MKILETKVSWRVGTFLIDLLHDVSSFENANSIIFDAFGIKTFFENDVDFQDIRRSISTAATESTEKADRVEYGDFQTNVELSNSVARYLTTKNISPEIIVEPTCGQGSFITAGLKYFSSVQKVFGIEIYKPYVWACKFNVMDYYLNNPTESKPEISIVHNSVFDFDFIEIAKNNPTSEVLVIGNPPWVTNSKLGNLNSANLPKKTNLKNLNGLDAITGKGNFDIAESIAAMMIETFQHQNGSIALLVKNSVIKNIVFDQFIIKHSIADMEKCRIDSKKEFNVSVDAALFYGKLNANPALACAEFDFYADGGAKRHFGWLTDKFVADMDTYFNAEYLDGICPFEWRQGIKHDCSSVMEMERVNDQFINGLQEEVRIENDLLYGVLKSSDLKNTVIKRTRKYTIITQKRVGQETDYIKHKFPQTFRYLSEHQTLLKARKSCIYTNKPPFSIFGVGDYSFKPYKVAISGLYKTFHFTLVLPQDGKPVMLDDTCYMLGFDTLEFAVYTLSLLNAETTMQFLQSITFPDAKRTFTKDVLMRIDLLELAKTTKQSELQKDLNAINGKYGFNVTTDQWNDFIKEMQPVHDKQLLLFA